MTATARTTFDTLDDAARAFDELREEETFVREQLRDIKTTLDLILAYMKREEVNDDELHAHEARHG